MPLGIGVPEVLIVLVIVLIIFGPKRLPDLGRSLGSGMRNFKDSITGKDEEEERQPELTESRSQEDASDPAAAPRPTERGEAAR